MPNAAEVRAILERYFEGPITDAHAAIIDAKLRETMGSTANYRCEIRAFYANAGRYHGRLWREELDDGPIAPDPKDLVPWFGSTLTGFPRARPYCPPALVGSWEGDGAKWHFDANGAFSTTHSSFAPFSEWYSRRRAAVGDLLLLAKRFGGPEQLVVESATADELLLRRVTKRFELRRAT